MHIPMVSLLSRLNASEVDLKQRMVSELHQNPFIEGTCDEFSSRFGRTSQEIQPILEELVRCAILGVGEGVYRFDPNIEAYNEVSEFVRRQETEAASVRREVLELEAQDRLRKLLSVTQKEVVTILEMVPAGVILLDEYGNLLKCNALARDFLGISTDASPVNICEVLGLSQEETLRSKVAVEVERDRPLSVISRPFQLEGSETGAVVTVQDISDRRALEAQTNREREAFFSMIRHELKKPLLHVERFLESLEGPSGTELMQARSSASHLGDMVDDMLFLAPMERDPMAVALADRVSLNFLLVGGDLAYRGRAKAAKVELQMVPVEEDVYILGDEKRLNQVVENLP